MKRRSRSLIILCAIFLVLILARGWIEIGLRLIQRPFVSVGTWFYQKKSNPELENRLVDLAIDKAKFEQLILENQELKQTLNFLERNQFSTVSASIISRSDNEQSSTFLVDRGSDDGIEIGDPVVVKDGVLIGKIISTDQKSSTVVSLSDRSLATAVSLMNQSKTIGVAEGMSQNLLKLKFIPQETELKVNDLVITSGLEPKIPSGLLIGIINDVKPEDNAPFLEAVIEPLVDVRQHTIVHILIKNRL